MCTPTNRAYNKPWEKGIVHWAALSILSKT